MQTVLSDTFGVPTEYFTFPAVIFDFILPFVFMWYVTYLIFRKIPTLRRWPTWILAVIAFAPGLFGMRMGRVLIWPALFLIPILKFRSWKSRIVAWIIIFVIFYFALQYLRF